MIPVADPRFDNGEREAVEAVLESGMIADGPEVRRFEAEFARYCGTDQAIATSNGTTALHAALEALGIGAGDRVVTTPFSFVASANAIRLAGATPVFADIDPETYTLDPEAVGDLCRDRSIDGILAVHLYGCPAAMDPLSDVAETYGIPLIEDAAQAHGARYRGSMVGTLGDAAAFSFYPTKNMTTGEGGMVLTDREAVAERAASYVNHGRTADDSPYAHERVGHNLRMTSLAAAIGRVQLERLPEWIQSRRENAERLSTGLADVPGITPPVEPEGRRHAYHQYTIRCENRDRLREHLEAADVGTGVYYPAPIHQLGAYEDYDADVPAAERAAGSVLSLPVHPGLSADEVDHVLESVRSAAPQVQ